MHGHVLEKKVETPTPGPSLAGASVSGLPLDLLQEASKRLGWAALIYAATFFLAYFGAHFFFVGQEGAVPVEQGLFSPERTVQTIVAIASIALALAVFALSRFANLRPSTFLDIGLVFEVVGAFGIAMSTMWGVFPEWTGEFVDQYPSIPWECVWIIIFPLLAPNTPGKVLLASLAAASTGMLTVILSRAAGLTSPAAPLVYLFGWYLFTTYLCAGIAFVISKAIYRFGKRLSRAREIGSYQLLQPLGQGGMGEVWMARHRMLARPAAIKLIRPEALGADVVTRRTVLRRFEREARATATLDSNHTITVYDFGVTQEGAFYYVMELLKGLNFDVLVKRFGPVDPARAVHLLRQACHSLAEAHERGLVHRDIKPANIYTCRLGFDYDFVKVLDFGLVKSSGGLEAGASDLTADGVATGTPAYMAPELALGKTDIDGRADIYGLGCVAYWLVCGQRVFEADTPLAMVVAHVQETPLPPSRRTELPIPATLEQIILTCLEKDPAERPQTASELDHLLAGCGLDSPWSREQAEEWWTLHMPEISSPARETFEDIEPTILTVKQ